MRWMIGTAVLTAERNAGQYAACAEEQGSASRHSLVGLLRRKWRRGTFRTVR